MSIGEFNHTAIDRIQNLSDNLLFILIYDILMPSSFSKSFLFSCEYLFFVFAKSGQASKRFRAIGVSTLDQVWLGIIK